MYNKLILVFAVSGIMLISCKIPNTRPLNPSKSTEDPILDSYFQNLHEKGMFNGGVAVIKEGKLLLNKTYGNANFRFDKDFYSDTPMEVASLSKQFTAAAILLLEQKGILNVQDKVQKHLGEKFPYPKITIKHLLTHTSGLTSYTDYFKKNWDQSKIATNEDILRFFTKKKPALKSVPGEKYDYSNSGYVVLAEIVHAVSGMPLDEFLHHNIFLPAGMKSSGFYDRDSIWEWKDYAPAYMLDLKTCQYTKPENLPDKKYYTYLSGRLGPGRLSSSVNDLIKWDSILKTNSLLEKKSKEKMFKVYMPSKDTSDYGFGWHIYTDESLGKVVYHTGSWAGNLTYIKRYIENNSVIIILNNTYNKAYIKEIRTQVEGYLKAKPLVSPKYNLVALLKKESCNLNEENLKAWYKTLSGNLDVSLEDLKSLKLNYQSIGENEKADLAKKLITLITESN